MSKETTINVISFLGILGCAAFFLVLYILFPIITNNPKDSYKSKESFNNESFRIFNHLKKPLYFEIHNKFDQPLVSLKTVDDPETLKIDPSLATTTTPSIKLISSEKILRHLIPENYVNIHILEGKGSLRKIRSYSNLQIDEVISKHKQLHIGMVTSRFIGSTDSFRMSITSENSGSGQPWIDIYNLSNIPLSLNGGDILIEPQSSVRFQGPLNMRTGVPLGTYLKDDLNLYDVYQYLRPYNNIYFGLSSAFEQPMELIGNKFYHAGCQQHEFSELCVEGATLWPLEEGIY